MWRFLGRLDEDIARSAQAEGCPHCGGPLHRSDCDRACWGLPMELRGDRRRCGLRCGRCGVRRPVESVRFFGRRFYVAPLFMLVCVLLAEGRVGGGRLSEAFSVGGNTLRRWRRWWREIFAGTGRWRQLRLERMPEPGPEPALALFGPGRRGRASSPAIFRLLARLRPCPWPDCPPD